jgi:hypothetical protein
MIRQSSTPDMFCKHLLVYINSKVPFHENLPPLPSHRSGVPDPCQSKAFCFLDNVNMALCSKLRCKLHAESRLIATRGIFCATCNAIFLDTEPCYPKT